MSDVEPQTDTDATLTGTCDPWPSKAELLNAIQASGFRVVSTEFSIRVSGSGSIVFRHLVGDVCPPAIDGDASTTTELFRDAAVVSSALAAAGIRHRLEIYDDEQNCAGCFHHQWPSAA